MKWIECKSNAWLRWSEAWLQENLQRNQKKRRITHIIRLKQVKHMFGLMCAIFYSKWKSSLWNAESKNISAIALAAKWFRLFWFGKQSNRIHFNFILSGSIVSFWHISVLSVDSTKAIYSNANKMLNVPILFLAWKFIFTSIYMCYAYRPLLNFSAGWSPDRVSYLGPRRNETWMLALSLSRCIMLSSEITITKRLYWSPKSIQKHRENNDFSWLSVSNDIEWQIQTGEKIRRGLKSRKQMNSCKMMFPLPITFQT